MPQNQLIQQKASKCTNCTEWLQICNAECCREYSLVLPATHDVSNMYKGSRLLFQKVLTKDKIRYFELHGANYVHGILNVKLDKFMIKGNVITIFYNCKGLTEDLKCKYHGTPQQPKVCHSPNITVNKNIPGVTVTENCLYRFK